MEPSQRQIGSCDYISDLPDNVLHHVLSFLPIKDIIRTSFLSRRWRYMWISVPTLDFDGLVFSPKPKFVNFVDSVLLRRDSYVIHKLSIRFGNYYCTSTNVDAWILAAINHGVRELSISSYGLQSFYQLPDHIFTCRSLTNLTLNLNHSTLNLPSAIHLPFLKTVKLSSLIFEEDNLPQFFHSCPILENVLLEKSLLTNLTVFNISSTSLQSLSIDDFPKDLSKDVCKISISTPNILSFEYKDYSLQDTSLGKMPLLRYASIDFKKQVCGHHVSTLLVGLSSATMLTLSSASIKLLSAALDLSRLLPNFSSLRHLKLTTDVSNNCIRVVTCFLHNCPRLELLSVTLSHRQRWLENTELFKPQSAECVVNYLKVVQIRGFTGDIQEVVFMKYLLEHACILERMSILMTKQFSANSELQMKIREDILVHPRGSTNCEISFEWRP